MPSTAETGRKPAGKRGTRQKVEEEQVHESKQGLTMHTLDVHAPLHLPYLTPGDIAHNARTATEWLPPGRDLAFYGGVGALAVAGALDWPVALAIGGATLMVRGLGRKERAEHREPEVVAASNRAAKESG